MSVVALITWILAAGGGFIMLSQWVAKGGARAAGAGGGGATTRFTPGLVFGHFALAAAGLVIWIIYLVNESDALAWTAFVLLAVVAVLGITMFLRWLPNQGSSAVESSFPKAVVYAHGLFAVTTAVLVLLVALGVGS
jgi:hypothetical protein